MVELARGRTSLQPERYEAVWVSQVEREGEGAGELFREMSHYTFALKSDAMFHGSTGVTKAFPLSEFCFSRKRR